MVYYQQPAAAEWYGSGPQQRIMYMQYVQPGRTHARSTQAASALVAGETIATGTYLKGKLAPAPPFHSNSPSKLTYKSSDYLIKIAITQSPMWQPALTTAARKPPKLTML